MKNKPILVLGCQRSGTTLLNLILDSHPQIHGFDEMVLFPINEMVAKLSSGELNLNNLKERDFTFANSIFTSTNDVIDSYLINPQFHPYVSFQIPMYSANFSYIKQLLPDVRILWCLRDPRDVVASMIKLQLPLGSERSVSWAVHPFGASVELKRCIPFLTKETHQALSSYLDRYYKIEPIAPVLYPIEDIVFIGALCWRIKNELLAIYERDKILVQIVNYEQLVSNPSQEINKILKYLELPWHDNVLKHHQYHTGTHIGNTERSRPIDHTNIGKWRGFFSDEALQTIHDVTKSLANKLGYDL